MIANRFNPLGVRLRKPYAYEVEYIRNTWAGQQSGAYLVLDDYIPQLDDHFVLELANGTQSNPGAGTLFSTQDAWRTRAFTYYAGNMWVGNKDKKVYSSVVLSGITKLEYKNRVAYINDSTEGTDFSDATDEPIAPLVLWNLWNPTTPNTRYFSAYDLLRLTVVRNGATIMDLRGVVDNQGVVCACNFVTERLYYNQGVREFIAGPRI